MLRSMPGEKTNYRLEVFRAFGVPCLVVFLVFSQGCCSRKPALTDNTNASNNGHGSTGQNGDTSSSSTPLLGGSSGHTDPGETTGAKVGDLNGNLRRARITSAEFNKQFNKGMELSDAEEYGQALEVFEELVRRYPNTEEASVAAFCIAEIHFRNKANKLALEAYKEIVSKYPNTQAAISAKEGIRYLETFEEVQKQFISPEVEDMNRRGY